MGHLLKHMLSLPQPRHPKGGTLFSLSFLESRRMQQPKLWGNSLKTWRSCRVLRAHHFGEGNTKSQGSHWRRLTFFVAAAGHGHEGWLHSAQRLSQTRQILLPLPKDRRKHWVSAGLFHSCFRKRPGLLPALQESQLPAKFLSNSMKMLAAWARMVVPLASRVPSSWP